MKKFIIKTLLLILPLVVLAISVEYLLRKIPNDYSYKKSYLDTHSEKIQILILGHSHTYLGVDPTLFAQNTFNAAHTAQTFDFDLEIFNKYRKKFTDLKIIIIPISYFSFWLRIDELTKTPLKHNYVIYYGTRAKCWRDYSEFLIKTPKQQKDNLYMYYFNKKDNIYCTPLGHARFDRLPKIADLEEDGKQIAARHTCDNIYSEEKIKIFTNRVEILESFAEFCNQNNVKLILLTTPTYYTYRKNLNMEQLHKMFETINNFVQQHNGVQYINYHEDSTFTTDDFYDATHLNQNGATKLSIKLANYIDSLR